MGTSPLSAENATIPISRPPYAAAAASPTDIQSYEIVDGSFVSTQYIFWNQNGELHGYRLKYQTANDLSPNSAQELRVTKLDKNGISYVDDGAKISIIPSKSGGSPTATINDQQSKANYRAVPATDPGLPGLVNKIQKGRMPITSAPKGATTPQAAATETQAPPAAAGANHDPTLNVVHASFMGQGGITYALLSEREGNKFNGEPMELAIISNNGDVRFFSGQVADANMSGFSLNTKAGRVDFHLFGDTKLDSLNLGPPADSDLDHKVAAQIGIGRQKPTTAASVAQGKGSLDGYNVQQVLTAPNGTTYAILAPGDNALAGGADNLAVKVAVIRPDNTVQVFDGKASNMSRSGQTITFGSQNEYKIAPNDPNGFSMALSTPNGTTALHYDNTTTTRNDVIKTLNKASKNPSAGMKMGP